MTKENLTKNGKLALAIHLWKDFKTINTPDIEQHINILEQAAQFCDILDIGKEFDEVQNKIFKKGI